MAQPIRKAMSLFRVMAASFALFGCGGGGGGGGSSIGGGTTITPDQRGAVLTAAGSEYDSLQSQDPAAANQQMVTWLKQQPQFEAAGVSGDGCAWGRFTDGRLAIFVNNRPPLPADQRAAIAKSTQKSRSADQPSNLPDASQSNVACVLGSSYDGGTTGDLATWVHDATGGTVWGGCIVDTLKTEHGDGIFYIDTHGGSGTWRDNTSAYAIWTATEWTADAELAYKDMLDNRELAFMYATRDFDASNKPINEWHFAITAKFVRSYMTFAPHSLVFIDACSSDNQEFRAACLAKGGSVYAGWTAPVNSDKAVVAATHMIDRLCGANAQDPESPKQRPFDWKSVYTWMQQQHYDEGDAVGFCRLAMTQSPNEANPFGLFRPSIAFVFAHDYEEKLYIYGIFGDNPGSGGKVTVDGTSLEIQEWAYDGQTQMDRIVCNLPFQGPGSAGNVQVTVRKSESNTRQLSRYNGWFKLTHDTGDGRKYVVNHYLRFRVDLQSLRMQPGETPKFTPMNPQRVFADQQSYADYEASGIWVQPDGSVEWSGKDTLLNNIDGSSNPRGFIASIRFDPAAHEGHLTLSGGVENGLTYTVTDAQGRKTSHTTSIIYGLDEFDGKDEDYQVPYAKITLGSDWGIEKGKATATKVQPMPGLTGLTDTATIEWDAIPCEFPPKDDTSRSASPRLSTVTR